MILRVNILISSSNYQFKTIFNSPKVEEKSKAWNREMTQHIYSNKSKAECRGSFAPINVHVTDQVN